MPTDIGENSRGSSPLLPCTCANFRRAARAVTRLYNRELSSDGIEITQFTLLMALNRTGDISQGELGKLLALDSTTLTRMLDLLRKQRWVETMASDDRRLRILHLTKAGKAKFRQSLPNWKRAQDRLKAALGRKVMSQLSSLLGEVTRVAVEA